MIDHREWDNADGIEMMVRAAGSYVRASDNLRPRVLEEAQISCREQLVRRCLRHMTMLVLLAAFFTVARPCGTDSQQFGRSAMLAAAGFNELLKPAAPASIRSGDGDWRTIDAFTELRRQQALILRWAM